ncbi:MAG: hypothetical protein ABSE55_14560 [Terracidiphilus sp.]|jgi:hypothetical protein
MNLPFTNTQLIIAAIALVVVVLIAVGAYLEYRKSKTRALRNRFGTEYDRAVVTHGSSRKAENKLADRETRVEALKIRDLEATERERYVAEWHAVQSRFVDHPKAAVTEADDLVNSVLEARGYPRAGFEQRANDVSVTYPRVMDNYRLAHGVAVRPGQIEASTEELRTAMIQYRAIFDELLQPQKPTEHKVAA